jgi:hypothetical protein
MKFLLVYLFFALVVGIRDAAVRRERLTTWPLLVGAFVLGVGFLSLRVINQ